MIGNAHSIASAATSARLTCVMASLRDRFVVLLISVPD
jgi:hypothetical protein